MNRSWTLLCFAAIFASGSIVSAQCETIPDCELVWSDEFDGQVVDQSKWEFQNGDGTQFGIPGWGNNELQWYSPANASVANGVLTIQAREQSVGSYDYTSTRMRTLGLGDWTYGRFEMRARLPVTQGMWPAFWMLSSVPDYGSYAATGEIDIMESRGSNPEEIFGTIHYGGASPNVVSSGGTTMLPAGTATDFHVYAIEWKAGQIRWYVDGQLYSEKFSWFSTGGVYPAPFDVDFHLLLNLAVGGSFGGNPDNTTVFPQDYVIDYVRVYQRAVGGTPGAQVVFDDMDHGNPFGNSWFIFGGSGGSGGSISSLSDDVAPGIGGAFSIGAAFGPGPGFLGGFGRSRSTDLSGTIEFSFWVNPAPNQSYTLEVNLQEDDTGDGVFTPGQDDEFQFNCVVAPSGPCAVAGGGWQKVTIPLAHFYDDNTFSSGGNGTLDANGGSEGLLTAVVMAISDSAGDANFVTDHWTFDGPPSNGDADGDGIPDSSDDFCASFSEQTTLTGFYRLSNGTRYTSRLPRGQWVEVRGTGVGPNAQVWMGSFQLPTDTGAMFGVFAAQIPPTGTLSSGTHEVRIINPEGCRSLGPVTQASVCTIAAYNDANKMALWVVFLCLTLFAGRRQLSRSR